ncbi:MAG: hypothetical protein Q8O56_01090 [Solirubrobacteraceae bacterium]|nr:hypothetical protein [Solirubrobacteraceae bacterium]
MHTNYVNRTTRKVEDMHRRFDGHVAARPARAVGGRWWRRRNTVLAGTLTAAMLGLGAQASQAQEVVEMGAANNVYQTMREAAPILAAGSGAETFTSNATPQVGGWWNALGADSNPDTTTLRGITSGNLRKQLLGPGPYTAPGAACSTPATTCPYGPLQIDAFFSADQGNVNQVLLEDVDGGTCETGAGQGQGGENVTACPGREDTKTLFTVGRLAIYSCDAAYATEGDDAGSPGAPVGADPNGSGNGVPTSPNCKAAPVTLDSDDMDGLVEWLDASDSNKMAIALPSSAPFGAAARQALINASTEDWEYDDSSGNADQNAWPAGTGANQCEGTLPTGAVCQVRLEAGISQVRGAVTSNTVQVGLAALSNLRNITWTSGPDDGLTTDDPNVVIPVPESAYTTGYGRIEQYAVGIERSTPDGDKEDVVDDILGGGPFSVTGTTVQTIFANYGYEPLP